MKSLSHQITLAIFACFSFASCDASLPQTEGHAQGVQGLRGEVRYEGKHHGVLRVAAFASFPPRGAPVAQVEIQNPQFPQAYELPGVQSGRVFILAILDVDAKDGERYRPSVDPGGAFGSYAAPETVTIDDRSASAARDIQLIDPSESSPWSRPGYR